MQCIIITNAITTKMFKKSLCFEKYLAKLPLSLGISFTTFRLSNHNLPIEKGRHDNIVRHERQCTHCKLLGDVYHYLYVCKHFQDDRKLFLSIAYRRKGYTQVNNYNLLFSTKNDQKLCKLTQFVEKIMTDLKR